MSRDSKLPRVKVTAHAKRRAKQLGIPGNIEHRASYRLYDRLRQGAVPDKDGAVHAYIGEEAYAVYLPDEAGGWVVPTVYVPGVKLDGEEVG